MTCNKCNSTTSCSCSSLTGSTGTPYYASADCCLEDSCTKIYYQQYALGFSIESSWNIPQCGGAALVKVPGVTTAPIGSYLWNSSFGYFQIVSFDVASETMSISNPCLQGNASPGVEVPRCTVFTVGPPPCCEDTPQSNPQSGVYLKIDFTAPGDGICIPITVTSLENLAAGDEISLGSGIYSIQSIDSSDVITICNDGNGITPGTSVIATDLLGQYVYPIYTVSNCCANISSDQTFAAGTGYGATLLVAGATVTTSVAGISITNPATNRNTHVMVNYHATYRFGSVMTGVPEFNYAVFDIETSVDGSPYASLFPFPLRNNTGPGTGGPADPIFANQFCTTSVHTILPGATLTINARALFTNELADTTFTEVSSQILVTAIIITA